MNTDILSDILSPAQVCSCCQRRLGAARAPSSTPQPVRGDTAPAAPYHLLVCGDAWLTVDGAAPRRLSQGDLVIVPHGHDHAPSNAAGAPVHFDPVWLNAIRRHLDLKPQGQTGLLSAQRDRQVGRALALIHEQPAKPWTVEGLATDVAMSRSAFYEHFVRLVGQPPMQYLTNWRMKVATSLLRQNRAPISAIALDVGYESEAAFTRAFKRLLGMPPARWRRDQVTIA